MKKILNLILRFFKWLFSINDNNTNEGTKQEEEMVKKYIDLRVGTSGMAEVIEIAGIPHGEVVTEYFRADKKMITGLPAIIDYEKRPCTYFPYYYVTDERKNNKLQVVVFLPTLVCRDVDDIAAAPVRYVESQHGYKLKNIHPHCYYRIAIYDIDDVKIEEGKSSFVVDGTSCLNSVFAINENQRQKGY